MLTAACTRPGPALTPAEELTARLQAAAEEGTVLYGHQDDLSYGHAWRVDDWENDGLTRSDVRAVCGRYPAVLGFDLGGIEQADSCNLDGVPFGLIRKAALTHSARGGIVTFSWHIRNPFTGGDAWDVSSTETVASVLEGGEKHDLFMEWLGRAADFLASLEDADGRPVPVVFRPWHEHTGSWFWWGKRLCTVAEYTALWRMTHDYLTAERGLSHLVWAYSPGGGIDRTEYMERYPGDAYADVLGTDIYEYVSEGESWASANGRFIAQVGTALDFMTELGRELGKPIALTETGLEGIPYPEWWTQVLLPALGEHPVCYVLTWRNAWDQETHFYGPFPGAACEEDFRRFAGSDRISLLSGNE